MELPFSTIIVGAFFIFLAGVLIGCGCYSWERHYRFKRRGSANFDVGVRFDKDMQTSFFGLQEVNDLLKKGQKILAVKEGNVLARKVGEESGIVHMHLSGFSISIEFCDK